MRNSTISPSLYFPDSFREFTNRRLLELSGIFLLLLPSALGLAIISWSIRDPSFNHATDGPIKNWLGAYGAVSADLLIQMSGIATITALIPIFLWGWRLILKKRLERSKIRLILLIIGGLCACAVASALPVPNSWPLPTGLGGVVGDALLSAPKRHLGSGSIYMMILNLVFCGGAILALTAASGYGIQETSESSQTSNQDASTHYGATEDDDHQGEPGLVLVSFGAVVHGILSCAATIKRWTTGSEKHIDFSVENKSASNTLAKSAPLSAGQLRGRVEPSFESDRFEPAPRVARDSATIKIGQRITKETQPSFLPLTEDGAYVLPPLFLLTEPKTHPKSISEDALEQNARLLEGVLDDFGVKGDIINVRPGPVVTLYELEPAPGIKSSRVIGLADDIARSMSAISARVAVVQGRNVIGIELPNHKRETVYLRELLASQDFERTKQKLAIALGKTIGGEPVIVDLARMPHLLVAGTTGSGKSVAINTMILSLLYRLKPEECRLIMVDPKMLELSVYDGIPHLLTPVVTDPKKAVVALKWAVREMEDRYKKMSKVGVRNIDGFNARVAEASTRGEVVTRTVQTGYDRNTGEAIYEQEEMDLKPLPYIVVIVDEMADLMMVAGKDIEGAIQRLAQMARAAGIHLIMATQRPSVDVITGTIKANFPTRISFQVTSKIDSRTILGEQGAEQLLGQGDMLYMAGGGRISRTHGPFVSDGEVEKIVAHLKEQGQPEYLDAIILDEDELTENDSGSPSSNPSEFEESGDLYDRAINIVLRDRKCSTSYIQRRLSVGYNKAASLVERMEKEGVISSANHAGKREILIGEGADPNSSPF